MGVRPSAAWVRPDCCESAPDCCESALGCRWCQAGLRWIGAFERRLVPDESILQTIAMHSRHKYTLLNHNLRWIDWPHSYGDPNGDGREAALLPPWVPSLIAARGQPDW